MPLDRERAEGHINEWERHQKGMRWLLDRLEECVLPDDDMKRQVDEAWKLRALAEAKLSRVDDLLLHRAHHDEHGDPWVSWEALNDALYGEPGDRQPDKDAEERLLEAEATLSKIAARVTYAPALEHLPAYRLAADIRAILGET